MASNVIVGNDLGMRICRALGLRDRFVKTIEIHIQTDDVVLIDVQYIMEEEQADNLVDELSKENPNGENKSETDGETLIYFNK